MLSLCNNTPRGGGGKTVRTDHGGSSPTPPETWLVVCTDICAGPGAGACSDGAGRVVPVVESAPLEEQPQGDKQIVGSGPAVNVKLLALSGLRRMPVWGSSLQLLAML